MPRILHIETSTEICSIAISQGTKLLSLQESDEAYAHGAKITLLIEAALKESALTLNDLDAIALSKGPGSYTALRIGTSTAKGIGYALNKPLIAIDSLEALAWASRAQIQEETAYFAPMIDARRMEVYTAVYDSQLQVVNATEAKIIDATAFEEIWGQDQLLVFAGNGAPKCSAVIQSPFVRFLELRASAAHMISLAEQAFQTKTFVDLAYFSPNYFKSPNITKPKRVL